MTEYQIQGASNVLTPPPKKKTGPTALVDIGGWGLEGPYLHQKYVKLPPFLAF